jgi:L-rhamnose isomerase
MAQITPKTWRDSLPIDMLLSAVSLFIVALPSWEISEGVMTYSVYLTNYVRFEAFNAKKLLGRSAEPM